MVLAKPLLSLKLMSNMKILDIVKSYLVTWKYALLAVVFVGLVGWNANLQRRLAADHTDELSADALTSHARSRRSADIPNSFLGRATAGGAIYVRWGRRSCPDEDTELVYSGIVGASIFTETGGSAEYICLTKEPQYSRYTDALESAAKIVGVEFDTGSSNFFNASLAPSGKLQDADVVCAVCRSQLYSTQVMIPGRKECSHGWKKEYWGYLMTAHPVHKAQHSWACVDNTPEGDEKGARNDNGGLMFHVQGVCGSLPCPKYVQGRELTCVVCTK